MAAAVMGAVPVLVALHAVYACRPAMFPYNRVGEIGRRPSVRSVATRAVGQAVVIVAVAGYAARIGRRELGAFQRGAAGFGHVAL